MSIGDVLARLREEFPDVTISKLRFLEAEGLVEPARTAAGYRKYSGADLRRVHFVLAAQRDNYLPLRVIREHLEAMDRGEAARPPGRVTLAVVADVDAGEPADAGDAKDGGPRSGGSGNGGSGNGGYGSDGPDGEAAASLAGDALASGGNAPDAGGTAPTPVQLSRTALRSCGGVDEETLAALESAGLITANASGWYDADALAVAEVAAAFAEYGLGPRHLRAYRAAADREVGMIAAVVAPLTHASTPAARARATDAALELTALSRRLHAALVRVGLRETLGQ